MCFRLLALLLCFCAIAAASDPLALQGVVTDQSGAVIPGAQLQLSGNGYRAAATTSAEGNFVFGNLPISAGVLQVSARGFALTRQAWTVPSLPLHIALRPALKSDEVTVSATRIPNRLSDSPASIAVLSRADLSTAGALTLDDTLRQLPGFTLFRRSGSLAANPTSQGVSLRGAGASGASRALVLYDGVPVNDPFGGWIYWDRVPQAAIQHVEVLRGGASDLYGTAAMAGLINLIPRRPPSSVLEVETYLGNSRTPDGSLFWNARRPGTALTAYGEAFSTGGYYIVREQDRGTVDTKAGQGHRSGALAIEHDVGAARLFLRGALFREDRENGTVLQINNTRTGQLVAGADWTSAAAGAFQLRAYGEGVRYYQTFSAVAPDRDSELLTRTQVVPAQRLGVSGSWSRALGPQTLLVGIDAQDIRGHSNEFAYAAGRATANIDNGGRQQFAAIFAEDILRFGSQWLLTAAVRVDHWRNFDGFSRTTPLATAVSTLTALPPRGETAASPRVSLLRRVSANWSLAASAYSSFRAPSLNELYRPFRVGNTLTLANNALRAERLRGAEAGVIGRVHDRVSLRGTFFWQIVSDPIANVTLSATRNLITQQRQNLGRTRSRGAEFDADVQLNSRLTLTGGYQFADATVVDSIAPIAGKWIPQVPRQQFSLQGRYSTRAFTLALQGRYVGVQFEDDRNLLPLDAFFTLDAFLARRLNRHLEVFAAAQNLLNSQYMVGRTPTITVGPPLLARLGMRFTLGGR